jgi:hypothetical protein
MSPRQEAQPDAVRRLVAKKQQPKNAAALGIGPSASRLQNMRSSD